MVTHESKDTGAQVTNKNSSFAKEVFEFILICTLNQL